jgi:hypothetical protein
LAISFDSQEKRLHALLMAKMLAKSHIPPTLSFLQACFTLADTPTSGCSLYMLFCHEDATMVLDNISKY